MKLLCFTYQRNTIIVSNHSKCNYKKKNKQNQLGTYMCPDVWKINLVYATQSQNS